MAERSGLLLGARLASGAVAAGIAAVVVAAVALLPLPDSAVDPRSVTVDPAPADQVRVCPGAAVRVGQASGDDADRAFVLGAPDVAAVAADGELTRSRVVSADDGAPASAAPEVLTAPADGALVAGAQLQDVDAPDFLGLAAAACVEPTGSAWLVGGATTVGRSTLLLLSNPTEVAARVSLQIWGENGAVSAPGMSGIDVAPGTQRVLSLAGFAPGLASPVVQVTARGGRVVAALQQSIVRGLDATGVETTGPGAEPATSLVIPGVRIVDAVGVNRAGARSDWYDVAPVVRIAVPGDEDGTVEVRVSPVGTDGVGTSFVVQAEAGQVVDIPLDAGVQEGGQSPDPASGESQRLGDGLYTVQVDADVPVVAAVRASTAVDTGESEATATGIQPSPPSDLAWFTAAAPLDAGTLLTVPAGPNPVLSIVNPTAEAVEVELAPLDGGAPVLVAVPAGTAASQPITPGAYRLAGTEALAVGVSFADAGRLAAFVLAPARPLAGPVVVHPD